MIHTRAVPQPTLKGVFFAFLTTVIPQLTIVIPPESTLVSDKPVSKTPSASCGLPET